MKKIFLFILLGLIFQAQTDNLSYKIDNDRIRKLYKTYEDYKANKPVEGFEINEAGGWDGSYVVTENGIKKKAKGPGNFPGAWLTDNAGSLMRIYNGYSFYVVVNGPISYFIPAVEAKVLFLKDGTYDYYFNSSVVFKDYYAETLNGDIKELNKKTLNAFLEKYNLKEQYYAEKVKGDKKTKKWIYEFNKLIKYINIMNEKAK